MDKDLHMNQPTQLGRRDLLRLGIGLASAGVLGADVPIPVVTKVVKTTNGDVQGLVKDGVQVLKGIRYGAAPVGPLRFMPPQRPKPWKGVADATEFGAPAIQMAPPISASPATDFGRQLATIYTTPAEIKIQNEDCLFLNVWTPGLGGGTGRPVMVWLHGGGFAYGSGAWPIYDGANLAKKGDVVVVTVNHRLNVFGYLYLAQIGQLGNDAYAKSGNAGMLDLVAALEWVRDNIEAFGGDPGNVTIFGESGGGGKVSTLMAMPGAKGLFHKGIVESGSTLRVGSREDANKAAERLVAQLGITPNRMDDLQKAPMDKLLATMHSMAGSNAPRLGPVVDGRSLPRNPFDPDAPSITASVPMLIGTNRSEERR